ncbi:MAG: chorismate mutase [Rhodospirillales bacterium]|nr:chorismate mutase [Rhodospirillales bacterium]
MSQTTSETLSDLRQKIDSLDDRVHDLLMERADLISRVAAAKKEAGIPVVAPAREAVMIRRLMARHRAPLPKAAVIRIWRELVGAVTLLQNDVRVAVAGSEKTPVLWDLAKDYFGSVIPMTRVANPSGAVSSVREGESTFAVLPWPEDGEDNPWWVHLDGSESARSMKIVARLPHGDRTDPGAPDSSHRALVIATIPFESTGDDRSFLILESDQTLSRARIVSVCKDLDMPVLGIQTRRATGPNLMASHLVEVESYVTDGDERIAALLKKLEDTGTKILCVGGYSVPPVCESWRSASERPPEPSESGLAPHSAAAPA